MELDYEALIREENLRSLMRDLHDVLEPEPAVIDLTPSRPVVFVGDIHGNYEVTERVMSTFAGAHFIFLGDYIDRPWRELGSLYNLVSVAKRKVANPERITLLRGNHEYANACAREKNDLFEEIEKVYGHRVSRGQRYGPVEKTGNTIVHAIYRSFTQLPFIVKMSNGILALHGGLPDISSLQQLNQLERDRSLSEEWPVTRMEFQITWNRISEESDDSEPKAGRNFFWFGKRFFTEKMELFDKQILVRGHQLQQRFVFDSRCVTLETGCEATEAGSLKESFVATVDPQKSGLEALALERVEH